MKVLVSHSSTTQCNIVHLIFNEYMILNLPGSVNWDVEKSIRRLKTSGHIICLWSRQCAHNLIEKLWIWYWTTMLLQWNIGREETISLLKIKFDLQQSSYYSDITLVTAVSKVYNSLLLVYLNTWILSSVEIKMAFIA